MAMLHEPLYEIIIVMGVVCHRRFDVNIVSAFNVAEVAYAMRFKTLTSSRLLKSDFTLLTAKIIVITTRYSNY